jgi:ketosteroid isomerase-like protein
MSDRSVVETLLQDLYAARLRGDLSGVLACFSPGVTFQIKGSSQARQIAIIAVGTPELRPWLALMVKTFRLLDLKMVSTIIDPPNAAVHWRARIVSKVTGTEVLTDFVDLVRVEDGRIAAYSELFVPC